jgi:hypothetical protein
LVLFGLFRCCFRKRKAAHTAPSQRYISSRDARRQKKERSRAARRQTAAPVSAPVQEGNNLRPAFVPLPSQQSSMRNSGVLSNDSQTQLMQEQQGGPVSYRPPSYPPPAAGAPSFPPQGAYQMPPYAPPNRNSYQQSAAPNRTSGLPYNPRASHNPFADESQAPPQRVSQVMYGPQPPSPARPNQNTTSWITDEEARRMNGN